MNSGQTFFKCISTSEKMGIPPAVVTEMQGALGNRVILRDRYRNVWAVEVDRSGDEWSFKKGWPQFYEENSLKPRIIVVFEYKGGNLFDFKMLGDNECEMEGIGAPTFRGKEEEVEEDYVQQEEEEADDDDEDYVEEEKESEEEKQLVNTSKKTRSFNNKSKPSSGTATIPSKQSKKKLVSNCYGTDIFEQGLATRPKNRPFFVSRSRSRKNELLIPKEVIVDYQLEIPNRLFLVDEGGKRWEALVKKWKDGRVLCTKGWKNLCNVNNIHQDDICICEFLLHPLKPPSILVRSLSSP